MSDAHVASFLPSTAPFLKTDVNESRYQLAASLGWGCGDVVYPSPSSPGAEDGAARPLGFSGEWMNLACELPAGRAWPC